MLDDRIQYRHCPEHGPQESGGAMARCDVCGNDYDKAFSIKDASGQGHTFDSFECAIHALAPACGHCGCKIVGHGVEANGAVHCCAYCAGHAGHSGITDRVGT